MNALDVLILCAEYDIAPELVKERYHECAELRLIVANDDYDSLDKYLAEKF